MELGITGSRPTYPTIVSVVIPSRLIMLSVAPLEASQPSDIMSWGISQQKDRGRDGRDRWAKFDVGIIWGAFWYVCAPEFAAFIRNIGVLKVAHKFCGPVFQSGYAL